MKVSVKKLEGSKVNIEVSLTAVEFNEYYEIGLNKVLETVEMKGFRKGKVPKDIYLKKYGQGAVYEEAINEAISKTYYEALQKKKVLAVDEPKINIDYEKLGADKPFKYNAIVDVYPEVKLGEYYGVEIQKESVEVTEEEIQEQINIELKNHAELELVEGKPLEKGQTAIFDFLGKVDGNPFEGGKAENYSLEIGSNKFIPGFEEQMVGMNSGEVKDIKVVFPENYQAADLAGKEAVFTVTLHEIKKQVVPELTEEFIAELDQENIETVEQYKENIKNTISDKKIEESEHKVMDDIIETVCNNAIVDLPESMVTRRAKQMLDQVGEQAKQYGLTLEQFLQFQGLTVEKYQELIKEPAQKSVLQSVVLEEIAKVEKIKLTAKEYKEQYEILGKQYNMNGEEASKAIPKEQVTPYFVSLKTMELLKEKAVIK
ncbi:MAG: trigger factor [Bacilli bacterium]|jgi:trigger factor|nr:trigger factor [Bacilli bacterium]MDD2682174.1 trigger factor [Bacilli bacterium]MDD3121821.1 trigger factor [Bacilli bacterium]MDD4063805.1 trigger factor [Bacilli bacterium]MDD4482672.1 trigger factor [Bacilli bacterium]